MRLTIYTADQGELQIENFDEESALDLTETLSIRDQQFLTFDLGDGTVLVNRDQIVRLDLDG